MYYYSTFREAFREFSRNRSSKVRRGLRRTRKLEPCNILLAATKSIFYAPSLPKAKFKLSFVVLGSPTDLAGLDPLLLPSGFALLIDQLHPFG